MSKENYKQLIEKESEKNIVDQKFISSNVVIIAIVIIIAVTVCNNLKMAFTIGSTLASRTEISSLVLNFVKLM